MPKFITVLASLTILLSGCSGLSAEEQAGTLVAQTVTAAPANATPGPAFTPAPITTLAPRSTATPNMALTSTVEAVRVLYELDVEVGESSGFPYEQGRLAWQQTQPITIDMSGPQRDAGITQGIDETIQAANFIFKSDVTWNASGILICGVIFRAEQNLEKGEHYQFYFYRLSGLPAYVINVYEFGRQKYTVSDIKFSDTLNVENNGSNQFVLVAQDSIFTIYINGKPQGTFIDESRQQRSEGTFGFLGWQDSGQGSCRFENSWVWVLE